MAMAGPIYLTWAEGSSAALSICRLRRSSSSAHPSSFHNFKQFFLLNYRNKKISYECHRSRSFFNLGKRSLRFQNWNLIFSETVGGSFVPKYQMKAYGRMIMKTSYCSYAWPAQPDPIRCLVPHRFISVIKLVSALFGKCTTLMVTKCWPIETRLRCGDQWKAEKLGAFFGADQ